MIKDGSNISIAFLNALDVKFTKSYSDKFYKEHPYKYNLFGISRMLSDYGIKNAGIKIEDKINDISEIQTPFIAHTGGDFSLVYCVTDDEVEYRMNSLNLSIPKSVFCDNWSGVILLAEKNEDSIEPNYSRHHKKELGWFILRSLFIIVSSLLVLMVFINNESHKNWGYLLSLIFNIVGLYVGFLLVQKQLKVHSRYSDKICSLFKRTDCNNILESNAARLFGIFGWSEIGFAYFLSNIILIAFLPNLISYYALLNILALPYTIWSVLYQKFKAKQWCVLCLIVQLLLWCIFITSFLFNFIHVPQLNVFNIVLFGSVYLVSFLSITLLIPLLSEGLKIDNIIQEINSLKAHEGVLSLLLKEQPYYECDKSTSNVIFGNPEAPIWVTILTNPHCAPCAKIHERIEKILESHENNLCIQYVFSSFGEELDISSKFLISTYLNTEKEHMMFIYDLWFKEGKFNKESFFEQYPFDLTDNRVIIEFDKHFQWKQSTKIDATPTILINGYKLPNNYQIEDLRFFTKLDI